MGYSREFTREQVIAGLLKGNRHRFIIFRDGFCETIERERYEKYRKCIENTLDALDMISDRLYGNAFVQFNTLMWEDFSIRTDSYPGCFSSIEGCIATIARRKPTTLAMKDMYRVEFIRYTEREAMSDKGTWYFRKTQYSENGASYLPFTLRDLSDCMEFRSFDTRTEELCDDGFELPDFEGTKLLNELLRESRATGITLPVDLNTVMRAGNRTKYDILSQRGRMKDIPKSVNRYPLVVGYMMKRALTVVGKEGLARFQGRNAEDAIRMFADHPWMRQHNCRTRNLTTLLDYAVAVFLWPKIDAYVSVNYLSLCRNNKVRADLSIKNEETMLEAVAALTPKKAKRNRKMKVADPFRILEGKIEGYRLLKTNEEMENESLVQHNCVKTYVNAVNSGYCGIFTHTNSQGKRFTIEVRYENSLYRCAQFKGSCNSDSPADRKVFTDILDAVNTELNGMRDIRLHGADLIVSEPEVLEAMAVGEEFDPRRAACYDEIPF